MAKSKMLCFLLWIAMMILQGEAKIFKPGTTIEIECPNAVLKQFTSMRTYALVLTNAQKSMEIKIYITKSSKSINSHQKTNKIYQKSSQSPIPAIDLSATNITNSSGQTALIKSSEPPRIDKTQQSQSQLIPECRLNKDNKICVLDSFISQLNIKCNNNGSISLLIVEPAVITEDHEGDTNAPLINEKVISPVLQQNVKGVLIFKPSSSNIIDPSIVNYHEEYREMFISNCIQSISYFEHRFLLGIMGRSYVEIVMVNEGIVGEWIFYRVSNAITHTLDSVRSYSLANEVTNFYIEDNQLNNPTSYNYHGFRLLLCSENISQIAEVSINVTVLLKIGEELIGQEQVNQTIHIKEGSLIGKIPIRIAFFYSEHPLHQIYLCFSKSMHYIFQLSESRLSSVGGMAQRPTIEEDQFLFYSFENRKVNIFEVQVRVIGEYRTKITPALRIMSNGIDKISSIVLPSPHTDHNNQTQGKDNQQIGAGQRSVQIENNKIFPVKVMGGSAQALFLLFVTPQRSQQNGQDTASHQKHAASMQHFKLMLESSYIPVSLTIGEQMQELLSQSQIKRYTLSSDKLEKILPRTKHMKIICTGCHAFATYNPQCSSINCCEYAHVNQIDVKPISLMIIVLAVTGHANGVGLIKLKVTEDNGGFLLEDGKIVEGLLWNTDMYLYETDGKYDLEIVINSQMQSILLLASTSKSEFPTKLYFDYQSNEGYIKIPALKSAKTIYIRLLKMATSFSEYSTTQNQLNYRVPYSIVIIKNEETGAKIQMIQGKQFNHVLSKGSKKQYKFSHFCNTYEKNSQIQERLYLRVDPKSQYNVGAKNLVNRVVTLKVQIIDQNTLKIVHSQLISHQDVIEVTNFISKSQIKLKKQQPSAFVDASNSNLCSVTVVITNQLTETLSLSLMFFKENQMYQIYPGQFTRDRILTNGHELMLYCVINPNKESNIYVYSMKQEISIAAKVILVKQIKQIPMVYEAEIDRQQKQYIEGERQANNFTYKTLQIEELKFASSSHHIYFPALASLTDKNFPINFQQYITVALLKIKRPSNTNSPSLSPSLLKYSLNDIFAICAQNQSILQVGSRLQYKLEDQRTHSFYYSITQELVSNEKPKESKLGGTEKEIILQTIKLDGNFRVRASLKYLGQSIAEFNLQRKEAIKDLTNSKQNQQNVMLYSSQAIIIIKTEQIRTKLIEYLKNQSESGNKLSLAQIQYNNLFIEFQLSCHKFRANSDAGPKYCQFLTTLQTSQSDIRELSAGIPQVFHINKHSSIIFIYDNTHDKEFKFKVNRKSGFPNYKLCSYRQVTAMQFQSQSEHTQQSTTMPTLIDKCLSDLRNQENYLNLRIEQNAFNSDQNLIIGRTHQLIINQFSEHYCTNCTYYLALYSDYDIVEGSIFIMVSPTKQKQIRNAGSQEQGEGQDSATMIQQGSSITTIVYRGEPDRYAISDWDSLMAVVYELEGNVDVQVYYFDSTANKKMILMTNNGENEQSQPTLNRNAKNTITINLQNSSFQKGPQQNESSTAQIKSHLGGKYFISISPSHNMPSSLYTLVIMNKYEQIVNIKDGVPYQMRYQISDKSQPGKGLSPNVKFRYSCENEGVIMISTKDFEQLDVRLTCQDQANTIVSTQQQQGNPIDISQLLNARKSYKLSNRLDIAISPKTCTRYQLSITSKLQTVAYSVMVSSTDIITLPLNKQMPGLLKYQTKLYQIYQISVPEKIDARVIFKFCQGGNGRIMIAKSKKNVYQELYEQEIEIYQDSTFETIKYKARPGLFYIKIEFKARDGVLEYTIYVQNSNVHQSAYKTASSLSIASSAPSHSGYSPIAIYNNMNTITYKVKHIKYDSTEYEIEFYPIVQEGSVYEIEYYILESTKLQLLKKTQNCNGQYFVELVSHHEQIKETKINAKPKQKQPVEQNQTNSQLAGQEQSPVISFEYSSSLHSSYITIIPMVYNKQTHEFYHLYVPKYHEVQLTNGQIFSKISYILSQVADKIEQVVDIHGSEYAILGVLAVLCCGCLVAVLVTGIVIGGRYFFKTRTVYVMKEGKPEQSEKLHLSQQEQLPNNSSVSAPSQVSLMREQEPLQQQQMNSYLIEPSLNVNGSELAQDDITQKQQTQQEESKEDKQEFVSTEIKIEEESNR